jgi:FtsP/CotA-like multicopper oxidase with cupredoxin domain
MTPSTDQGGHDMTGIGGTASMSEMAPHANDFDQDAYLANERTLNEPDVIAVERGGRVRLRIINAAASTNFHIDTGALDATLVAVDGTDIVPVSVRRVPLAMGADRLQIDIPAMGSAFPVLALREGARERTGVILATAGAVVQKIPVVADAAAPPLDLALESQFSAGLPLPRGRPTGVSPFQ